VGSAGLAVASAGLAVASAGLAVASAGLAVASAGLVVGVVLVHPTRLTATMVISMMNAMIVDNFCFIFFSFSLCYYFWIYGYDHFN
jgi:hypothetical protein